MNFPPCLAPPVSPLLEFRPPTLADLPHLLALQTDESTMRYYGGVRDSAAIQQRMHRAIEHHARFGYGLWSIYKRMDAEFIGLGGIIHYDFDLAAVELEGVVCIKREAQGRLYAHHILPLLYGWFLQAGLGPGMPLLLRVEPDNHRMVRLLDAFARADPHIFRGDPVRRDSRYLFYEITPPARSD